MKHFNRNDYCEPMIQVDPETNGLRWVEQPTRQFLVSDCLHKEFQNESNPHHQFATANMRYVRICEEFPGEDTLHVYEPILNQEATVA